MSIQESFEASGSGQSALGQGAGGEPDQDETLAKLMSGELARRLGLTTAQLRVGLTVARNMIARGSPADALRIYAALVLCEPRNVDFQLGLANCASLAGEHYLAIQAASAAIALAPANPRGYLFSGRSCLATGSLAEAREDLDDALKFARSSRDAAAAEEAQKLLDGLNARPA